MFKIMVKPLTFQHKKYVYWFHFQYPGWDMVFECKKKVGKIQSGECGRVLKKKTQNWFYSLSLSDCVTLRTQGLCLILTVIGVIPPFYGFWWKYMVSTGYIVLRLGLGYMAHGFESTGYMVSEVLRYRVHSFSLPLTELLNKLKLSLWLRVRYRFTVSKSVSNTNNSNVSCHTSTPDPARQQLTIQSLQLFPL